MLTRIAADLVVLLHAAFIAFAVFGGFLAWRWPAVAWIHIPAALWGAWIEFTGSICPLTPLENSLRQASGEAGYAGGFIEHYLLPILYPAELTRPIQVGLGAAVILVNSVAYVRFWTRRRRTSPDTPRRPAP